MMFAAHYPSMTNIFPVGSQVQWDSQDIELLESHLQAITRAIEPRVKNLELAIKTIANKDKRKTMEVNLNSIVSKWHDHCKRLGATPIGLYRCKIHMKTGQIIYWEFPKGFIVADNTTLH